MNYSVQTINEFGKGIRKFFKWLNGKNWEGLEIVKGDRKDERKPNVLTEEIFRMIEAAANKRDRAIIAVGYEAGLRIGELSSLSWKNVVFTDWGVKLKVSGKTGERFIPVVMSAGYLREWLLEHPSYNPKTGEIDPESLVFVRINGKDAGKPMTYQMFAKIIKKAAKKAEINKRVYPHILRHSMATVLANHLTEQQLSHYFGWVQGSSMPAVYVHLSGRDIEDAIKKI
ncbi:MAG: tyrosine-type recombinase/integrase [Archaeoglobaceae archaeon]